MKHFIVKLLAFLLLLTTTAAIIEILLRGIPNDYQLKSDYLDEHSDSIQVLFLGGSHTLTGINPDLTAKRSFNAAHNSQTLEYDYEILKKYRNRLSSLEYIVLPVSYPSLYVTLNTDPEAWRAKNYILYYRIRLSRHLSYHTEVGNGLLWLNFSRIYNYYFRNIDNIDCSALGWVEEQGVISADVLEIKGIEAAKRHTITNDDCYKYLVGILDSIVDFANQNNCKLLLFTPPAYRSYNDNMNQTQWNRTVETVLKTVSENEHSSYYNFNEDSKFIPADFHDGDHLNPAGAQKLTLMLDSIINVEGCLGRL